MRERKRLIRHVISDVTLIKAGEHITAHVRFAGGQADTINVPRLLRAWETHTTPPETLAVIDQLLAEHTHDEAVSILNARGLTGGWRKPFTVASLTALCKAHGVPPCASGYAPRACSLSKRPLTSWVSARTPSPPGGGTVCSRRGASTAAAATSTTPVKAAHRCSTRPKPPAVGKPTAGYQPISSPRSSA